MKILSTWYKKPNQFSLELMKNTTKFCKKTITKTKSETKVLNDNKKNQQTQTKIMTSVTSVTAVTKCKAEKNPKLYCIKMAKHSKL